MIDRIWLKSGRAAVLALWAIVALGAVGCSSDDNGGSGTPLPTPTATATNSPRATTTPTPVVQPGEYTGSADLGDAGTADVEITVAANGDATGTLTIDDASAAAAADEGGGAQVITVAISGSVNLQTGQFTMTGSYPDGEDTVEVTVSGVIPGPGRAGVLNIQIGDQTYSGTFDTPPPPTEVPVTPTSPPGESTPTPTQGTIAGVSTEMLGTFAGEAKNETTNVEVQARLRIEVVGGAVRVTDLLGTVFSGTITMNPVTPTNLSYNAFGNPVVTFTLSLVQSGHIAGIYGETTPSFPPMVESLGLNLFKES